MSHGTPGLRHPRVARLIIAVVAVAASCASPTVPHWVDEGVHAVDGYWLLAEYRCDLTSTDPCVEQVGRAEAALSVQPSFVVGGSIAGIPKQWVMADGRVAQVIFNTSGIEPHFVILDLVDGTRRIAVYGCGGIPRPDGSMLCTAGPPSGQWDNYRIGQSPIN